MPYEDEDCHREADEGPKVAKTDVLEEPEVECLALEGKSLRLLRATLKAGRGESRESWLHKDSNSEYKHIKNCNR